MGVYKRWELHDSTGDSYVFVPNPNKMTTPFPTRNITMQSTTAVDGKVLLFEGTAQPVQWTFGGDIQDHVQYEALRSWVYDRTGRRVWLFDHFGRRITLVLTGFAPEPVRAVGKYWRHGYTVTAIVIKVGAPSVGEVPA